MIQIIGTKKCRETQKMIRACRERGIAFQFVDLNERKLTDGEINSIIQHYDADLLIDEKSQFYRKNGYEWRSYDSLEELREHPELMKTPIIRCRGKVHLGADTDILEEWKDL